MKLSDLFRRQTLTDETFEKLESNLSEVIMLEVAPPLSPHDELEGAGEAAQADGAEAAAGAEAPAEEPGPKLTPHTQARVAEFAAFETMHNSVQSELETISVMVARIKVAHHQTREFLNSVHSSIYRTNDLELSGASLIAENRVLARQSEHVERLRSQFETLTEAFKQREAKLVETADGLRGGLAAVKLELVEAQGRVAFLESEQHSTLTAFASSSTQAERAARENEVLREKLINLSGDLDAAGRRRVEADRKVDELTAMHVREAANLGETRSRLSAVDGERQRLQKQHDALQAHVTELRDSLRAVEAELTEQGKRHDVALQSIRTERDTLAARLQVSMRAEHEAAERISTMTSERNEALIERRTAEDRAGAPRQEGGNGAPEPAGGRRREMERRPVMLGAPERRPQANGVAEASPASKPRRAVSPDGSEDAA